MIIFDTYNNVILECSKIFCVVKLIYMDRDLLVFEYPKCKTRVEFSQDSMRFGAWITDRCYVLYKDLDCRWHVIYDLNRRMCYTGIMNLYLEEKNG